MMVRTCEMCFQRIGFRQGHVTPEGRRVCSSCLRKQAHDAGAPQEVRHCPFCGSGDVVGRSDGSIECGYCNQVCTIKVEPQYPNMPQTDPVTGQPMIPQDPAKPPSGAPGAPPGAPPPPGGDKPPFPPKGDEAKPDAKGDNPFPPKKDGPPKPDDKKPDDGKKKPPPFAKQQSRRRVAAKSTCAECGNPIVYIAPPPNDPLITTGEWMHTDEYQVWGTSREYDHVAVAPEGATTASRAREAHFITDDGIAVPEQEYVALLARRFQEG